MNTQILNKCIEELKKDKPDLSYIRGILETLVESTPVPNFNTPAYIPQTNITPTGTWMATTNSTQPELTDDEKAEIEFARRYNSGPVGQL